MVTLLSLKPSVFFTRGFPGGYNAVTSTFEYNSEGFANKVNFHLFDVDGVTELVAFTRASSSTCDNTLQNNRAQKVQHIQSANLKFAKKNLNHLPVTLTSQ